MIIKTKGKSEERVINEMDIEGRKLLKINNINNNVNCELHFIPLGNGDIEVR